MYDQTNYASQFGQGPQNPWPPAHQQRAVTTPSPPPPPPPPTTYIQPGPPYPSHPITQQTLAPPPQAGQPLHLSHSGFHGSRPHPHPPPLYQGPPGGITSIRQAYFNTFPPVHGSTQVSQFNSNAQQNVQLSHSGVQNMHHVLPPPPPLPLPLTLPPPPSAAHAPSPDLLRPPQPTTAVPLHPSSQGQTLYGARFHPPLQQGGLQVFPSIPHHPTSSNFPAPPSFGGPMQLNSVESHLLSMAPPPPPSSPPPIPPSPPPPTSPSSSIPNPDSSNLSCRSEFDPSSTIRCSKKLKGFEIDQGGAPPSHSGDNEPKHDDHINLEDGIGLVKDSNVDSEMSNKDFVPGLPPPPPKPKDDRIVRKIEALCQLIADNGSSFEDTTRHKEFGNPEFEFLFGGEPGTESAVGHEYFLWMKKKNYLVCTNKEIGQRYPLRSLRVEPQSEYLALSAATISPANSDMEMEDDITPADIGKGTSHSFEIQSYDSKSRKEEHDKKGQQLHKDLQQCSREKEGVAEDGGPRLLLDHEKSISVAACQVHSPVRSMAGISESPVGNNFESFVTCFHNEKNISGEVAASEAINSSQSIALITDGSPFRLIQDYSSDEDSESAEELLPKDVRLVSITPSPPASSKTSNKDSDNLTILGPKASCQVQRSSGSPCESSMAESGALSLSKIPKLLSDANEVNVGKTGNDQRCNNQQNQIGTSTNCISLDAMNGHNVDVLQETDDSHKENDEGKVKLGSSPIKIDEFGRLVREGGSDSDSDDLHYTRRRKYRRTRHSSESRSPVDRRRGQRSPWRRKDRRSRSRSWSPRNQRGRSRSPISRRASQLNSENMRRDRGMIQKCFDFQRGRCYRGASCRYVHHEPNKIDGSRHRSKHHDSHPTSKSIKSREDAMNMSREVSDLGHIKVENQESFQYNVSSKGDTPDWKTERPTDNPDSDVNKCQSSRDSAGLVQEELIYSKSTGVVITHVNDSGEAVEKSNEQRSVTVSSQCMSSAGIENFSGDISTSMLTSAENSLAQQPNMFVAELQTTNRLSHQLDGSFVSNLLPDQVTAVIINKAPEREHPLEKIPSVNSQFNESFAIQPPMPSQFLSHSPGLKPSSTTAPDCATDSTHPLRELPPPPPLTSSIDPQFDDTASQPPMMSQVLSQSPLSKPLSATAPGCATGDTQPLRVLPPPPPLTSSITPQFDDCSTRQPSMTSEFLSKSPVSKSLSSTAPARATDDTHLLKEMPSLHPLIASGVTSAEVSMPGPYNFVPQNVSFPSQLSLPGHFNPQQDFVSVQPSHYHSASSLPSKPLFDLTSTPIPLKDSMPMQFHQSHLSQGSDLGSQSVMKSLPLQMHSHSMLGESPVQELYRAPMHMDEIRAIAPVANNQPNQPFGFPTFQNEVNFGRGSVEMNSSRFFPHRNYNDQSIPFTNANRMLSSGGNFPPSEFQSSFSQFHPYSQFQQPLYSSQPSHDGLFRDSSQIGSMSQNYLDPRSNNRSSLLPDFGGLGVTSYNNPYASTFEKPHSSSFRSNTLNFGNDVPSGDIHDSTFNVNNVRVDGQGANYVGSRLTTASPNSTKSLGKHLPSSGGDQYDPLFDSFEPSSPKVKKSDRSKKLEKARESHMMTRLGGSHKLLDVEENNKRKEVAAVASTTSLDNDEFGETADAEAGDVENDFDDEADLTGEIEIDQVKSPGKSKKSKGSRSLRLFRIAIADFVKEILKPSWRQGNMSKEAFKTIVKKTVDKVSGAMKSHQIPKSQAKINRYMDSSQRKLTKLVMGYVDKYVKT